MAIHQRLRALRERWQLRFEASEEASFVRSLQPDIVKAALACEAISFVVVAIGVFPLYSFERDRRDDEFVWDGDDPRTLYFAVQFSWVGALISSGGCCVARLCGFLKRWNFEVPTCTMVVYLLATVPWCSKWHIAVIYRISADDLWGQRGSYSGSEMVATVATIGLLVTICQFVPIRTHRLWVVNFVGSISIPLTQMLLGSTMADKGPQVAVMLVFIAAFLHLGSRRYETQMRMQWRAMGEASERELVARGFEAMSWFSCEVILRLSVDGLVLESSKMQDSFFAQPMLGKRFAELLAEEDTELFEAAMQKATDTEEVQSMPARFEFSFANVRAQLAVVSISGSSTRFLVGIKQVEHEPKPEAGDLRVVQAFLERKATAAEAAVASVGVGLHDSACSRTCDAVSIAPSAVSDRVFKDIERHCSGRPDQASMRVTLEHIASIGLREHWLVGADEVELFPSKVLGSGGFGWVCVGRLRGGVVAVKVPRDNTTRCNANMVATFCNEVRLLRRVRHSQIVSFHGATIDPATGELAMIFEHISGDCLGPYVRMAHRRLAATNIHVPLAMLLLDVSSALMYLHALEPSLVHCDVKESNVKVYQTHKGVHRAKLMDFGLSRLLTGRATHLGGTAPWMAPELLRGLRARERAAPSLDVYSFGLLAHFTLTGLFVQDSYDSANPSKRFERLLWPEGKPLSAEGRSLCQACLSEQPADRPAMSAVMRDVAGWLQESASTSREVADCLSHMLSPGLSWDEGVRVLRLEQGAKEAAAKDGGAEPPPEECRLEPGGALGGPARPKLAGAAAAAASRPPRKPSVAL